MNQNFCRSVKLEFCKLMTFKATAIDNMMTLDMTQVYICSLWRPGGQQVVDGDAPPQKADVDIAK